MRAVSNLFRFVGLRHILKKPARSLLTTLGVSFGIALFIAIRIINQSTLDSLRENIEAVAGKTSLSISSGDAGFPENKIEVIEKTPGVEHAVPMVFSRAFLVDAKLNNETLVILGVDLLKESSVRTYKTSDQQVIDDPLVFLNQPDSIILTHEFANQHKLGMDSRFSLATTEGKKTFTVRGLLSPEGPARAYGGAVALMDIDGARMTFGKEGKVDRVDVVVQKDLDLDEMIHRLESALGPGYQVERPQSQSAAMHRMVKSYQMMMSFFSTLALLVGLFLITNSVSISVMERKREIGSLRAIGAVRSGILAVFLAEAVAMGIVGGLLGAAMGRVLASFLVKGMSQSMSSQYLTRIEVSHLNFGIQDILLAIVLGGGAAFFAAAWPAYKSTRIEPLEAMKNRDVGVDVAKKGFLRFSGSVGLVMVLAVSVSATLGMNQKHRVIEFLGQLLAILGSALLGPSLVMGLVRMIRPLALPLGGAVSRLAQDNLIRNPRRTASNVTSLMVGLILVIVVAAVNTSFRTTIDLWFGRVLHSDLIISSSGQLIAFQTQPLHESLAEEIVKVPGIQTKTEGAHVYGVYGVRFGHTPYEGKQLAIKAYDEPDPSYKYWILDVRDRDRVEAGGELFHSQEPVVMVSRNFVDHYDKKTGDSIELDSPTGRHAFRIVGVMEDFASDVGVLYLNRRQYREIWKDPLVNSFGVQLASGYTQEQVRANIDQRLGRTRNLVVTSNSELRKEMNDLVDRSFRNTRAIQAAALLVGLLGLLNTMLISVMERMREIGMLRAIGMSRRQISAMIIQETLFQGALGAATAVLLGSWLSYIWITYSLSNILGWIIDFYFPWGSIFSTVLIGILVALVASFFPARRAAGLEIAEALEYE
ncbi:MAG: ABC transporter permease [Bdellovibrio sp.]|nr:ABC transporter permease [Bdellovibrio sp.]